MARKRKQEEHVNHERWLISYADFITLLFAFFVVMYSVSSVNEGKYRVLSDALVAAFRSSSRSMEPIQVGELSKSSKQPGLIKGLVDQGGNLRKYAKRSLSPFKLNRAHTGAGFKGESQPPDTGNDVAKKGGHEDINKMADALEKSMSKLIQQDLIAVRRTDLWVEVEIKTSILFPSGSAVLQNEALPVLSEIAKILKDFPNPIRVEGFTDSVPINTVAFPSNWELSAGRAASVVHLFTKDGVEPRRMAAIGFGEYKPIADNSTPEGRNKNRRVVILILESASADNILAGTENALPSKASKNSTSPVNTGLSKLPPHEQTPLAGEPK
jgi:chemotaxis protein MotB